jgi:hypothetical protein
MRPCRTLAQENRHHARRSDAAEPYASALFVAAVEHVREIADLPAGDGELARCRALSVHLQRRRPERVCDVSAILRVFLARAIQGYGLGVSAQIEVRC